MSAVVTVLHVLVCIFLIAVVLLQRGKGAQIGAVFGGGGSSTLFGSRGAGNFLTKLTAIAATVYMLTSLSLSYFGITGAGERLFQDGTVTEEPVEKSLFEEVGTAPAAEAAGAGAVAPPAAEAAQPEAGSAAQPEAGSAAQPEAGSAAPAAPPAGKADAAAPDAG